MKKTILLVIVICLSLNMFTQAQDTLYIYKSGQIVSKRAISDIDSVIFYLPQFQCGGLFTDARDGKTYNTVEIGNQCWMKDNLAYETPTGSWYYNDDPNNSSIYGKLYSWQMASTSCPNGFRLPTSSDFDIMINYLGGSSIAGGKMKLTGFTFWDSPNTNATNSSGFSAKASGGRGYNGGYNSMGKSIAFWTNTQVGSESVYYNLWYNTEDIQNYVYNRLSGFSVRCIKE